MADINPPFDVPPPPMSPTGPGPHKCTPSVIIAPAPGAAGCVGYYVCSICGMQQVYFALLAVT